MKKVSDVFAYLGENKKEAVSLFLHLAFFAISAYITSMMLYKHFGWHWLLSLASIALFALVYRWVRDNRPYKQPQQPKSEGSNMPTDDMRVLTDVNINHPLRVARLITNNKLKCVYLVGVKVSQVDFDEISIERLKGRDVSFYDVRFSNVSLNDAKFEGATEFRRFSIRNSNFNDFSIQGAKIEGALWHNMVLTECCFKDVTIGNNSRVKDAVFTNCVFDGAVFGEDLVLINVVFNNCVFDGAHFINQDLQSVDFNGCDLAGATFDGCMPLKAKSSE